MRGRTSRRMLWVVLALLFLALLVPPFVNVNRYRNRVASSLSRAVGRDVTVSNIELKLLPRPGLVLSNFVIADDPSYSLEPMLRADTVTAYLRLSSLWRGRLEIGTLDLDTPSLNLVRRSDGRWNIEALVERTSQTNPAPTAKARPEARPRFPYVEASGGRINFKLGQVKKAFAFTDADFSLWLETENQWGVRLEARPMRTDINITDTGTLNLDGRFQRSASLRDTPLYFKLSFSDGPLGQISKLFYGRDRGWRGSLRSNAVLTGSPAALGITLDAQVDDFRRYDIGTGEAFASAHALHRDILVQRRSSLRRPLRVASRLRCADSARRRAGLEQRLRVEHRRRSYRRRSHRILCPPRQERSAFRSHRNR